jgi:hypothetical protein
MRVILVPLTGDDHDKTGLAAAYTVGREFHAHVAALFVRPDLVDVVADFEGGSQEVLPCARIYRPTPHRIFPTPPRVPCRERRRARCCAAR